MSDDALTEMLHQLMPFCAHLGFRGVSSSPDLVVVEMDWAADHCTVGGATHGGAIMSLADTAAAACAFANLPEGAAGTTTIEAKTNFLGAATEGTLVAEARPLHAGRTTIVLETEVRCGPKLVSKTMQTQAVLS